MPNPTTETPEAFKTDPSSVNRAIAKLVYGRDSRTSRVLQRAYDVLRTNRVVVSTPDGTHQVFTTPSLCDGAEDSHLDYSQKQWLWDSAAHAMNLAYTEPEIAKAELKAVCSNQNLNRRSEDYGFVPHMNYFLGDAREVPGWAQEHFQSFLDGPDGHLVPVTEHEHFLNTYWTTEFHSDITQPPILAMATLEVSRATDDTEFLDDILPALKAYYDYLHNRRADTDGLLRIIHPWESGWDNSQRWDEALGLDSTPDLSRVERSLIDVRKIRLLSKYKALGWNLTKILETKEFVVKPVDFNALYAKNLECLSRLCTKCGDTAGLEKYQNRSQQSAEAIFKLMWDGDKYVDLIQSPEGERKSQTKSAAMFYPMLLKGEPRSRSLIHHHLANSDEFNPPEGYMVPTTSLDNVTFRGEQYWRGNVWGIVNFFVHCAVLEHLKTHPTDALARSLAIKCRDSMFELLDEADFFEYFNPHKVDDGKPKGYGVPSFGWNGLALFLDKPPAFLDE